jgi:acetylornithine deacetylase/succinyl-diaminopimelate desuccinylase-like protein
LAAAHAALDAWIDAHFDEQVAFMQALVRIPTDTPPGNNAPHAEATAAMLQGFGWACESHPVPAAEVQAAGLQSLTNLVVRRRFGPGEGDGGRVVGLNAHGDVVPPGEGWTHDPYGGEVVDGKLYGRAAAVSKSDFASYAFATRALESLGCAAPRQGAVELYFTYDEEFGGELGPGWLLRHGIVEPDLLLAAGFSYEVVTAHNGCLQLEVTVHGTAGHAAVPHTAVDALQATHRLLGVLYNENVLNKQLTSAHEGISHPYLNVGTIAGGSNTNVVPGKVVLRLDRRMIPEEDPSAVEARLRELIAGSVADIPGIRVEIRRLVLARAMKALPGGRPLVEALRKHASAVFGEPIPERATPLYTDARLFAERGIPAAIYGAGPRTVLESNAKRADEHVRLSDLKGATRVVARTLLDLLR